MSHENTKNALTGFNSTSRMEKAQSTDTLVADGQLQTKLFGLSAKINVEPLVVDCLASIGLYTILYTENSKFQTRLEMENFLADISEGRYSRKAKKDGQVETAPTIPTSIEELDVSVIAEAMDNKEIKVPMGAEQLCRLGFYDRIPATAVKALEGIIKLGIENAERVKVLHELFSISVATITEETEQELTFSCQVPMSTWQKTFAKLKASSTRGWSTHDVNLTEDFMSMTFVVKLDKTVNEVAE